MSPWWLSVLLAQDARLTAEREGARSIAFPADLLASTEPRAVDAVTLHRTLFEARRTSLATAARNEKKKARCLHKASAVAVAHQQQSNIAYSEKQPW